MGYTSEKKMAKKKGMDRSPKRYLLLFALICIGSSLWLTVIGWLCLGEIQLELGLPKVMMEFSFIDVLDTSGLWT